MAPEKPTWFDVTHCLGCGYSLRGLARDGVCPECGARYGHDLWVLREPPVSWSDRIGTAISLLIVAGVAMLLLAESRPHRWLLFALVVAVFASQGVWRHLRMRRIEVDADDVPAARLAPLLVFTRDGVMRPGKSEILHWRRFARVRVRPLSLLARSDGRRAWQARLLPPFWSAELRPNLDVRFYASTEEARIATQAIRDFIDASRPP